MTKRKIQITAFSLLAAALIALLGAKPLYYLYREVSYRLSDPTEAEQTVHDYAREAGIAYGRYPKDLIQLLDNNPETRDFVLNYPDHEKQPLRLDGYSRDKVPLFLQWDPMWGYETYGSSFLAVTGCGPTSLAMAGYYLTGEESMNPLEVARFAEKEGYYAPGYGSSWTLISEGAGKLGLTATELPLVKKKIENALNAGNPVILALGKGDFTTTGHYIVLTGLQDGAFQVNDPNSPLRSSQLWTYEQLETQIRNIWEIRKGD